MPPEKDAPKNEAAGNLFSHRPESHEPWLQRGLQLRTQSFRFLCNSLKPTYHLTGNMTETIQTRCCIAGGGPAGMMLGFLLARAGVDVLVLEKHKDFLRDFRGDTIHPSTLELMYELGILDQFLKRPHEKLTAISAQVGREAFTLGDFTHLPTHCKFLALMPQWDFLNFLVEHARGYSRFQLIMEAEATDLIEENHAIVGLRAKTPQGELDVRAPTGAIP